MQILLSIQVEMFAARLFIKKYPNPSGRNSYSAVASREETGAEGEKMERQLKIIYSKVHPDVFLKSQPTPSHTSLKTGVTLEH